MAHAYTPELRVVERQTVRKERRLPLDGQVVVSEGQTVRAEDVVARTELPGDVDLVNVAHKLSVPPSEVAQHMLKGEGDSVEAGEVIARSSSFLGLFKSECTAPAAGVIEGISSVTGQVRVRRPPKPVEITAYVDGRVAECIEGQGVVIETVATFVQGILGVGGERVAELRMAVDSPDAVLDGSSLDDSLSGTIAVGGCLATRAALERAKEIGLAGLVVGGVGSDGVDHLLGYPLGVAITGQEDTPFTLVLTEGFGEIRMAQRTFDLLKSREGAKASIDGATQIRAGVVRPEVVIPFGDGLAAGGAEEAASGGIQAGDTVRIIREPHFGRLARVIALPPELTRIETEAHVRVVTVQTEDGVAVTLPRANIELIR